jgi:hypothetical protein
MYTRLSYCAEVRYLVKKHDKAELNAHLWEEETP